MCGDSFHVKYVGKSGKNRNLFLDMGRPRTYSLILKGVISNLVCSSEQIDALFLSHIHDDHIGGASSFIHDIQKDRALKNVVGRWIYNAPRKYNVKQTDVKKDGVPCGIVSGDTVYEHILEHNPSDLCDFKSGMLFEIDGLKVTILSPDDFKLTQLRDKYSNNRPLCKNETNETSVEAGIVVDDYSIPLNEFNLECFQEDASIENASSIAAMFELNGKRILWLGDSVPSVVVNSLINLGYSEANKVHCEAVMLSHHGSTANNSMALFNLIQSDKYIISADGLNRHCLPNKETVSRILFSSQNLPIGLYFNYDDGRLTRMFKSDNPESVQSIIDVHYLQDREAIEI